MTADERQWHELTPEQTAALLETDPHRGLAPGEAASRLERHGPNQLSVRPGRAAWLRFLDQLNQPLIYILLGATVVTALLGEWVDSAVIFGVVVVNAVVGFVQESRALTAIEALARSMSAEAMVVRAGRRRRIPAAQLVPGDVVALEPGDRVPADLRLVRSRELRVDESALTGESVPAEKGTGAVAPETPLADRGCMAYSTTLVAAGHGVGVVVATGDRTEIGRISELVATATEIDTPLMRRIAQFSRVLLVVILALAALVFVVGLMRGQGWVEMFMVSVALAVAAIPEGLPAAMTIMLAIGVSRMAQRRAIIRKLPAVETLGSTTVICSDKTGTLTENQMTVQAIVAGGRVYEVSGTGYAPRGAISLADAEVAPGDHAALAACLTAGALCNDSSVVEEEGRWSVHGDPTEAALIVAAAKGGLDRDRLGERLPRLDAIPFQSERQYMATLHADPGADGAVIYAKGSTERILAMCSSMLDEHGKEVPLDADAVHRHLHGLSDRALRVLALARGRLAASAQYLHEDDIASGLTFLGLQGMIDPPRQEAIRAIAKCHRAGIHVKMITGDHARTAAAIAHQMLLDPAADPAAPIPALTGAELARICDDDLPDAALKTNVFARVSPEQKLRLVRAIQSRHHIVAMTGDGVNDAPALRQADIGVAMGLTGTEAAREAADMVLTDDNFASIEAAVEEGRGVFDHLTKFIVWTIPTNAGQGMVVLAAVALGTALPILPVQILWINMTTALLLGLMLVFEPNEPDLMDRPPRDPRGSLLSWALVGRMTLVGALLAAGAFWMYEWKLGAGVGAGEAAARTAAANTVVFGQIFYLFNCRSLTKSILETGFFTNPWLLGGVAVMAAMQAGFTYAPFMNALFGTAPISAAAWGWIILIGAAIFGVVGVEKWLRRVWERRTRGAAGRYHPPHDHA